VSGALSTRSPGPSWRWARHYQDAWLDRSGDGRLPKWLRVAALAYGSHQDNGHAVFGRGEVALVLATVDRTTGEVSPMDRRRLHEVIQHAVEFGWLEEGSRARCLIVPAHAIKKGLLETTDRPCPIHLRRGS
jgi:hypothetical protein